jgi:hypothetical protein
MRRIDNIIYYIVVTFGVIAIVLNIIVLFIKIYCKIF